MYVQGAPATAAPLTVTLLAPLAHFGTRIMMSKVPEPWMTSVLVSGKIGKPAVCLTDTAPGSWRSLVVAETNWLMYSAGGPEVAGCQKKMESPSFAKDSESVPQQHGKPYRHTGINQTKFQKATRCRLIVCLRSRICPRA